MHDSGISWSETAKILGVSRSCLRDRLKRCGQKRGVAQSG